MTFQMWWRVAWQWYQPIHLGLLMHLIKAHRLLYVQVPQVVPNLLFSYSGRGFAPSSPSCSPSTGEGWGQRLPGKNEGKKLLSTSAFSSSVEWGCHSCSLGGYAFFNFPFLAAIPVETFPIILSITCQVQLQLCLGPPDLIPTQPGSIPIVFPVPTSTTHAVPSCPLVWAAGLNSAIRCLPFLAWLLAPGDWELLGSVENVLKDLPALFCPPVPEDHFPGGPTD